jgi:Alpha amylase, catalytic domain
MPFQVSPHRDDGYDVSDHYGVDPRYGTIGDFVEFTHGAKQRGIRVLIDLVVNHTSEPDPLRRTLKRRPALVCWSLAPAPQTCRDAEFQRQCGGRSALMRYHYSFVAENRRTNSGFSFANGVCVIHMRQGFPLQRSFAAPSRSICPAARTASSRAASRSWISFA